VNVTSPSAGENDKCNINVVNNCFETVKKNLYLDITVKKQKSIFFSFFHEPTGRQLKLLEYFLLPFV
jgi:hypothetical protein